MIPQWKTRLPTRRFLELGSGGSRLKEFDSRIITSDVSPGIAELVVDARKLPFPDASLHGIFLTHVFHHIPDVSLFLHEAERVLVPGGVIGMIDVAATPFARFFFSHFHPEPFQPKLNWVFQQNDSMMDSNQALSWIVFERDLARFQREYPGLVLEEKRWLPWLPYLLSGGVTRRDLLPNADRARTHRHGQGLARTLSSFRPPLVYPVAEIPRVKPAAFCRHGSSRDEPDTACPRCSKNSQLNDVTPSAHPECPRPMKLCPRPSPARLAEY